VFNTEAHPFRRPRAGVEVGKKKKEEGQEKKAAAAAEKADS
jgi:hypothetical protein